MGLEQTVIIHRHNIIWLGSKTETECAHCSVQAEYLKTIRLILFFKGFTQFSHLDLFNLRLNKVKEKSQQSLYGNKTNKFSKPIFRTTYPLLMINNLKIPFIFRTNNNPNLTAF
jgi:hypothetical protein